LAVVEVNGPESHYIEPPKKDEKGSGFLSMPGWLKDYQLKMRHYFPEGIKEEKSSSLSSINLLTRSFDLLQDRFCEVLIEKYPVDVMVRVSRKQAGTLEFHRAPEMIEIGRQKAKEALDKLENGNS
jgi:NTE family protein